jgi:hypothetical protein
MENIVITENVVISIEEIQKMNEIMTRIGELIVEENS